MKKVFENFKMKNINMKNRLVRSATWEGIANTDGSINQDAYDIYEELARGGVGLIITGFTSVALHDYYFDGMMRLCDDELIHQYKKLTDIIHNNFRLSASQPQRGTDCCPVITQLALGAYYRNSNGRFIQVEPDNMTEEEIKYVIKEFIDAAVRAEKAGFDGVQIHAAHFFFLSRFISPAVNHRTDKFGGSAENRSRILLEILHGIKEAAPNLHVTIKINSNDFTHGGITEDECLAICKILDNAGINSIEVSGNGTSVGGIKAHVNEGYFVNAAAEIAKSVKCPVIVVGGFRSLDKMEEVLNNTDIELISLSRPLLREPDLPNKILCAQRRTGLLENPENISSSTLRRTAPKDGLISQCISCNRCYSSPSHKCVFRGRM